MNETAKYEAKSGPMTLSQDFASVLQIIEQNRSQAVQAINHASVLTAWQVGAFVSEKFRHYKQFVPTPSAQIVSTPLIQIDNQQIVPFEMAQMSSLLLHTGWTNHQSKLRKEIVTHMKDLVLFGSARPE